MVWHLVENLEMAEKIAKNAIQKANRVAIAGNVCYEPQSVKQLGPLQVWGEDHVETQECLDALADIL